MASNQWRAYCLFVYCWIISQTSADSQVEDKCAFTECIFQGASPIDAYIPSLNFTELPDPLKIDCNYFKQRLAICNDERANCPDTLQQPFENRLHDYIYVDFLMQIGIFGCSYRDEFLQLKHCFNEDLESHLHRCFQGLAFDKNCLLKEFYKYEDCPPNAVKALLILIDRFLEYNPYFKSVTEDTNQ